MLAFCCAMRSCCHTYEMTRKHNGKVDAVITRKVSADGKTMVATVKNPEGSTTNLEKVN